MNSLRIKFITAGLLVCFVALTADAQDVKSPGKEITIETHETAAVLAVAESALAAISNEDAIALTDLMVDEAQLFPTFKRDGVAGYGARTRDSQRSQQFEQEIEERGWDPEVKISGTVAMVWFPYDLYIDGKWSHCGVDVFTIVRVKSDWKIASMAWSTEQPPACEPHPNGPPGAR